jgi:hypothetical protein
MTLTAYHTQIIAVETQLNDQFLHDLQLEEARLLDVRERIKACSRREGTDIRKYAGGSRVSLGFGWSSDTSS